TIVATSTIEVEYVAAASCCGQVLWIQNQLLDCGYNFINTNIYIDNNNAIYIVKNPVYHKQRVIGARSADDALIKGRRIDKEEGITGRVSSDTDEIRMDEGEVAVERTSGGTEEMATVLTSMDAATVFTGGIDVPTGSYSIPTAGPPTVDIHTSSDAVPTASPIIATATVVTPYSRRMGKEVMVESNTPKKQRLQEQIDAQVARELEEQQEREDKRMTEQIARDAKVARIHAEEEL
nr:putative ribonuclease H-like domain-containing protein [Tanacetum cinerariifolium]